MRNKIYKPKKKKTFRQAIEATPEVKDCHCLRKQAILKKERNKVELTDPQRCGGSLFIDKCLLDQNKYPEANRWDYAIDYNGEVFFVEFHSANSRQVEKVISKLEWLKDWLNTNAPEINKLKSITKFPYYWVQSSDFQIPLHSSQYRRIVQKKLKPIPRLVLK
jgi:hypothetical protein